MMNRGHTILAALLVYLSGCATLQAAYDGVDIDGANGVIYVRGALTESACRLEMSSARQDVELGTLGTGQLRREGRGTPVPLQLKLLDCVRSPSASGDYRLSTRVWNPSQPSVTVTFSGVTSPEAPGLLQVNGAEGMALEIGDNRGNDVRIGSRGRPLQLSPGQNLLTYYITPRRTVGPLKAGAFFAQVNFRLSYD
ncbi:fimbrial protein [Klebsiella aerogenes]